jgi:hypothetical protein
VYGFDPKTLACALGIRLAAISSMARVIFLVASTLLIRRLVSRSCAPAICPPYSSTVVPEKLSLKALIASKNRSPSGRSPVSRIVANRSP